MASHLLKSPGQRNHWNFHEDKGSEWPVTNTGSQSGWGRHAAGWRWGRDGEGRVRGARRGLAVPHTATRATCGQGTPIDQVLCLAGEALMEWSRLVPSVPWGPQGTICPPSPPPHPVIPTPSLPPRARAGCWVAFIAVGLQARGVQGRGNTLWPH